MGVWGIDDRDGSITPSSSTMASNKDISQGLRSNVDAGEWLSDIVVCITTGDLKDRFAVVRMQAADNDVIIGDTNNSVQVFDLRSVGNQQTQPMCSWNYHHNAVLSLCAPGSGIIFSGDGSGIVTLRTNVGNSVFTSANSNTGSANNGICYGIQVSNRGGVQCIEVIAKDNNYYCVCAGEDGSVLMLEYCN